MPTHESNWVTLGFAEARTPSIRVDKLRGYGTEEDAYGNSGNLKKEVID